MEEYFYLREYLKTHGAPEYIIYTQVAVHLLEAESFWNRSIYFHRMSKDDIEEVKQDLKNYHDTEILGGEEAFKELFFYEVYSPTKYSAAVIKGFISNRYQRNMKQYNEVIKNKGQVQMGTAECCNEPSYYIDYDSFHVNDVLDAYFKKLIELCIENHIQIVFQNPPLNESTYNNLQGTFMPEYIAYLKSIKQKYPEIRMDTDVLVYEDCYFGDPTHLNIKGTLKFSAEMKEKYHEIFGD